MESNWDLPDYASRDLLKIPQPTTLKEMLREGIRS